MAVTWLDTIREMGIVTVLVAGSLFATMFEDKELAMVLAGAAAGFASNNKTRRD